MTADSRAEIRSGERFAFGSNWRSFIEQVDDERTAAAVESLVQALGTADLSGRTFLDVGCGSGLFSLAAHRLGARVRSVDYDAEAVAATIELRRRFAPDADWLVEQGSILDERLVGELGRFDIVYAWGVLHHTGDLWRAMDLVAGLVAPGGLLHVSIYNDQGFASRMWLRVKRQYNRSGPLIRRLLIAGSVIHLRTRNPVAKLARLVLLAVPARRHPQVPTWADRSSVRRRAMSVRHDLVDWVGGYPFEVAKPEEVFGFLRPRGYELRHLKTCGGGIGCNEFVFFRRGESEACGQETVASVASTGS